MKKLIVLFLLIAFASKADDQAPRLPKKTDPKYQNGDIIIFKLEKFYRKACRSPQIPGFDKLAEDETIGIVDQFHDGVYRVVKVKCNSQTIYGWKHFDVEEKDIVKLYTHKQKKKKKKQRPSALGGLIYNN